MTEKEFEGKELDEALEAASSALGISVDDLHYEIIEQGRRGLLGVGSRNVRIRLKPSLETEIPIDDEEIPLAPQPERGEAKGDKPKRRRSRRRRGGGGRNRAASGEAPRERRPERVEEDRPPVDPAIVQQVTDTATKMIELMDLELLVQGSSQNGSISLTVEGGDQLQLTANNSELMLAMQFLLNRMSRRAWPDVRRIKISTDGQEEGPRDDELVSLTRRIADEVMQSGKTQKMRPMNAYERRLVHLTVRDFPGLSSNSDGRGAMKRVRISKIQNQI